MNSRNKEIVAAAQDLERRLTRYGAEGSGLGEKTHFIRDDLPSVVREDIFLLNKYRNKIVHEDLDIYIPEHEYRKALTGYRRAIKYIDEYLLGISNPSDSETDRRKLEEDNRPISSRITYTNKKLDYLEGYSPTEDDKNYIDISGYDRGNAGFAKIFGILIFLPGVIAIILIFALVRDFLVSLAFSSFFLYYLIPLSKYFFARREERDRKELTKGISNFFVILTLFVFIGVLIVYMNNLES